MLGRLTIFIQSLRRVISSLLSNHVQILHDLARTLCWWGGWGGGGGTVSLSENILTLHSENLSWIVFVHNNFCDLEGHRRVKLQQNVVLSCFEWEFWVFCSSCWYLKLLLFRDCVSCVNVSVIIFYHQTKKKLFHENRNHISQWV